MMFPKRKVWNSEKYLEWIRQQPCHICGMDAEVHHLKGIGGLSGIAQKAPSWACMPLCRDCHRQMHSDSERWDWQWEMIVRTLGKAIDEGVIK